MSSFNQLSSRSTSTVSVSSIRDLFENQQQQQSQQKPQPPPKTLRLLRLQSVQLNRPLLPPKPCVSMVKSAPPISDNALPFSYINGKSQSYVTSVQQRFERQRPASIAGPFERNGHRLGPNFQLQPIQRNLSTGSTLSLTSSSSSSYNSSTSHGTESRTINIQSCKDILNPCGPSSQSNSIQDESVHFRSIDNYIRSMVSSASTKPNIKFPWSQLVLNLDFLSPSDVFVVDSMSPSELDVYETIFQIVCTERSYLDILEQLDQFPIQNPVFSSRLSKYERNTLFGKIPAILGLNRTLYRKFVQSMYRESGSIYMTDIISILSDSLSSVSSVDGTSKFEPYIEYLRTMTGRTLLMEDRDKFNIEQFPNLFQLQMILIAPLQRITRYSILLSTIRDLLQRLVREQTNSCQWAVLNPAELLHLVERCWMNAKSLTEACYQALDSEKNLHELIELKKCLVGPFDELSQIRLVSPGRRIVDRIPVQVNLLNKQLNGVLILLNDLLVLAWDKMKTDKQLELFAWAPWRMVEYSKGPMPAKRKFNRQLQQLIHRSVPISHLKPQSFATIQFRNRKFSTTIFQLSFIPTQLEQQFWDQYLELRSISKLNS